MESGGTLARAFDFAVEDLEVGGRPPAVEVLRGCSAFFSCDAEAVARLLPSDRLHPLRWTRTRTLVMVLGGIYDVHYGALPSFRVGELLLAAFVTYGPEPAPPLMPLAGSTRSEPNRWGAGGVILALGVTSWIRREMFRKVFGWPCLVTDIRYEQRPGFDQVTCEQDGELLFGLRVRTGATPKPSTTGHCLYGIRDNRLLLWSETESSIAETRTGRAAAQAVAGDHPLGDMIRSLKLSRRPLTTTVAHHVDSRPSPSPLIMGEAHLVDPPGSHARATGRLLVSDTHQALHEVDQGLGRLPFDPAADIVPAARLNT